MGLGARAPNPALSILMIRCFGGTPYRSDGEGRGCVIHAACNVIFLLLVEASAAYKFSRLHRSITLASVYCHPQIEGRPEVSGLLKLGHLVPFFRIPGTSWYQENDSSSSRKSAVCSLSLQLAIRKKYYERIFIARLFEAHVVCHVIVNDSRRWYSLTCDSSDLYPVTLPSSTLFIVPILGQTKSNSSICMKFLDTKGNMRLASKSNRNFSPYQDQVGASWTSRNPFLVLRKSLSWCTKKFFSFFFKA